MELLFSWRAAVLTVTAAILLPLADALAASIRHRLARRTLAALLVVMTGVIVPWLIGFAVFYDRWWSTFAPFSSALFVPPLLYLHASALVTGRWPDRGWRHLLLGFAQLLYQGAAFLLPLPLKQRWADIAFDGGETIPAVVLAINYLAYRPWNATSWHTA